MELGLVVSVHRGVGWVPWERYMLQCTSYHIARVALKTYANWVLGVIPKGGRFVHGANVLARQCPSVTGVCCTSTSANDRTHILYVGYGMLRHDR
jgi:hypothetical protein